MEFPNGKQRRNWAKQSGHLKKKQKASLSEWLEMVRRSQETGKQIHNLNAERNLRQEEERKIEREQTFIQQLVENGMSFEEATRELEKRNGNMGS
jgi:hypothetical protein